MPRPAPRIAPGDTFGRWTVQGFDRSAGDAWWWTCQCVCGTERPVRQANLLGGQSKSCGCTNRGRKYEQRRPRKPTYRHISLKPLPQACHRLQKLIVEELSKTTIPLPDFFHQVGCTESTLWKWRCGQSSSLAITEACLNALGYELVAMPVDGASERQAGMGETT